MEWKYDLAFASEEERRLAEEQVRAELDGVVLLEVLVTSRDERFIVDDFGQLGSDQAPYIEVFLSADGGSVIAEGFDVPAGDTLRIAFYLHYMDPTAKLKTSYGLVEVPPVREIPERLADLVPYEPVT